MLFETKQAETRLRVGGWPVYLQIRIIEFRSNPATSGLELFRTKERLSNGVAA